MLHESYAEVMEYNDDLSRFDFVSIGEQGEIKKESNSGYQILTIFMSLALVM